MSQEFYRKRLLDQQKLKLGWEKAEWNIYRSSFHFSWHGEHTLEKISFASYFIFYSHSKRIITKYLNVKYHTAFAVFAGLRFHLFHHSYIHKKHQRCQKCFIFLQESFTCFTTQVQVMRQRHSYCCFSVLFGWIAHLALVSVAEIILSSAEIYSQLWAERHTIKELKGIFPLDAQWDEVQRKVADYTHFILCFSKQFTK